MRTLLETFGLKRPHCATCCDLHHSNKTVSQHGAFTHETSFTALSASAAAGCVSCTFLRDGARALIAEGELGAVRIQTVREFGDDEHEEGVERNPCRTFVDVKDGNDKWVCLEFYTDDENVLGRYPVISPGSHISTDPASAACISQAKKWLDYCLRKHHASCGASHTQNLLPTRVIDVGSSTQNPHLYEPAPMETGRYAALSYCWGKSRTFTTTLSTLRDRKRGFQLEDLPKTCRDAVIVARALGIQYVWIDSCCIIQDSASDWEAEAAKMCSVYSNSLITFAGVDSPDSDTGLFVTEPDRRTVALSIMLSEYGRMGNLYARKMNSSYKFGFLHASSRPISDPSWNGILNSRGWTLQEVILSPRLLCFGSWELGWCCRAETACECDPLLRSDLLFRQSNLAETPMTMSNLTNQASQDERLYIWKKTVSQFTRRQLSYQTDRLPALAGLAGAMQERIGGRYVAGMWEKGIETMVVWYCERNTKKYGSYGSSGVQLPMEQAYAPSWSWASVQGMVWFAMTDSSLTYSPLGSIVAVDFSPTTSNAYGPGHGTLTMDGFVLRLGLSEDHQHFDCHSDMPTLPFSDISTSWYPDRRPTYTGIDSLMAKKLDLAFLGTAVGHKTAKSEPYTIYFALLLERVGTVGYTRHGIVRVQIITKETKKWWQKWEKRGRRERVSII